jgi:hypothetical protein
MVTFTSGEIERQSSGDKTISSGHRQFQSSAAIAPCPDTPVFSDFPVTNRPLRAEKRIYVVPENNHYITVDEVIFRLHSSTVSPIGRAGKSDLSTFGKPSNRLLMCAAHKAD